MNSLTCLITEGRLPNIIDTVEIEAQNVKYQQWHQNSYNSQKIS